MSYFSIILTLLLASAFLSGIEVALVTADKLRLELERKKETTRGRIIAKLLDRPESLLTTTLVGYNLVLVALTICAEIWLHENATYWIEGMYLRLLVDVLLLVSVVLVFIEFLPKAIFQISPTRTLLFLAYPIYALRLLLYPLVWLFENMALFGLRKFMGARQLPTRPALTKTDLEHFIYSVNPLEEEFDQAVFQNALDINDWCARDCMVPRSQIQAVWVDDSVDVLRAKFAETRHSRLLIYGESPDDILGYFHHHFLLKSPKTIREQMFPIATISEFLPVRELLHRFVKEKQNVLWVLNEHGGTAGIVTLEDVLELIFGDIDDEHDERELQQQLGDHEFLFDGLLEIEYINEKFGLDLPLHKEYKTLSGYLVQSLGDIPRKGEKIFLRNYEFVAESVAATKIEIVRVIRLFEGEAP